MPTIPIHLSQELIEEIAAIGRLRAPNEACGVLLPTPRGEGLGHVVELPNRSTESDVYVMDGQDILIELGDNWLATATQQQINDIVIWHTHPKGGIGPSRGDMRHKAQLDTMFLVVSLTEDGPVASWF